MHHGTLKVVWEPSPPPLPRPPSSPIWLLLTDDADTLNVTASLTAAAPAADLEHVDVTAYGWQDALASLCAANSFTTVVYAAGAGRPADAVDADAARQAQQALCEPFWALVRALVESSSTARVWVVTRCAFKVTASDEIIEPLHALAHGLALGLLTEHPALCGGLLDVDDACNTLPVDELLAPAAHEWVAVRGGERYVSRLRVVAAPPEAEIERLRVRAGPTYIVTGGLGSVGLAMARSLLARGATSIALLSRRSSPPADVQSWIDASAARVWRCTRWTWRTLRG